MARKTKIAAGSLNVRLHPHSRDIYVSWLSQIFARRIAVNFHGERYAIISTLDKSEAKKGILTGVITTFTKIDSDGSWFNLEALQEATKDQVSKINIPKNLYPNSATFYFFFNANVHKLFFQTYSKGKTLSPLSAQRVFGGFASDLAIMERFNEAKISIVQDRASLARLFRLQRIKEIRISIQRPNTDIFDDEFEQKIEAHLAESHSKQFTITYQAESGGTLVATKEIRKVSETALENGRVEVKGRDAAGAVTLSSERYPKVFHDKYDPDAETERQAFLRLIPAVPQEGQEND